MKTTTIRLQQPLQHGATKSAPSLAPGSTVVYDATTLPAALTGLVVRQTWWPKPEREYQSSIPSGSSPEFVADEQRASKTPGMFRPTDSIPSDSPSRKAT